MKSPRKQTTLRLPEPLDKKLAELAERVGRSKNSYIYLVLQEHVKSSPVVGATGERQ